MIDLNRPSRPSSIRLRLVLTCAFSALAACSQGNSTSATTDTVGVDTNNSVADAPPPATALPLASGAAPPSKPAPMATALPSAPSAPLGQTSPADRYAYLNQAYRFSQSLADAPPDYTYDYQGERPLVWQSSDGYYRVAERLPMGVRYFYYAPGASTPYLVQDPQYSYGYSRGMLTAVYGPGGEIAPYDVQARQARTAGAYLAWAAGLYAAARHNEHVAVAQARWDAERQAVYADQARWRASQQRNVDWAAYDQAHQNDEAHWAGERYARAAEALRFAQAVNDQGALAHAQQAAVEARAITQGRAERPTGPAPQGALAPRQGRGADLNSASPGPPHPGAAGFAGDEHRQGLQHQSQATADAQSAQRAQSAPRVGDQAVEPSRFGNEPQRQAARQPGFAHGGDEGRPQDQARLQQAQPAVASREAANQAQVQAREAQAHEQQAAGHQAKAADALQRAAAERGAADGHQEAAAQAQARARMQNEAQAAEHQRAAQVQAHAQAPHAAPPPAKPKPEPEEHRPQNGPA